MPTRVRLSGENSTAMDGRSLASYTWALVDGPATPTIQNADAEEGFVDLIAAGTYVFELVVTDNTGLASSPNQVEVTVLDVKPSAHAGIGVNYRLGSVPIELPLLGARSQDGNLDELSFYWVVKEAPEEVVVADRFAPDTAVTVSQPGVYRFELTVTQPNGLKSVAQVVHQVDAPHDTVLTAIIQSAGSAEPGEPLVLSAAESTSGGDNEALSYLWRQLSGPNGVLSGADQASATLKARSPGPPFSSWW